MVTAIQKINPETNRQLVNVIFDKGLRIDSKVKICVNEQTAQAFIHKQYAFAIRTLLIRFAKQQYYIASRYPGMKGALDKMQAAETIIGEMQHHANSPLIVLTAVVYWLRSEISSLQPSEQSRYRKRYDEFVNPLIDFCFYHSKSVRSQQTKN